LQASGLQDGDAVEVVLTAVPAALVEPDSVAAAEALESSAAFPALALADAAAAAEVVGAALRAAVASLPRAIGAGELIFSKHGLCLSVRAAPHTTMQPRAGSAQQHIRETKPWKLQACEESRAVNLAGLRVSTAAPGGNSGAAGLLQLRITADDAAAAGLVAALTAGVIKGALPGGKQPSLVVSAHFRPI